MHPFDIKTVLFAKHAQHVVGTRGASANVTVEVQVKPRIERDFVWLNP